MTDHDEIPQEWRPFATLLAERRAVAGTNQDGTPGPLSLRELAARCGGKLSHSALSHMEKGLRAPTHDPERLRALAQGLGNVTLSELMAAAGYQLDAEADDQELVDVLDRWGLDAGKIPEALTYLGVLKDR